jgi:2-dehydropantoate 2-reductase
VVKSQSEALSGSTTYDFALVTTKCLPDVLPTPTLLADAIASRKVKAWSLIQNGLDVEKDLYEAVKEQETPIISSCAWIGVMTSPDGAVVSWKGKVGNAFVRGRFGPISPPAVFLRRPP